MMTVLPRTPYQSPWLDVGLFPNGTLATKVVGMRLKLGGA